MWKDKLKKAIKNHFVWCQCFRQESSYNSTVENLSNDLAILIGSLLKEQREICAVVFGDFTQGEIMEIFNTAGNDKFEALWQRIKNAPPPKGEKL